jgi:hypothetical protein
MKTNPFLAALVLVTTLLGSGAAIQTNRQAPLSPALPVAPAMAPDEIIYLPQLPEPAELAAAAAAQGLTVKRITRTSAEVTVTCQSADGQVHTAAYQLLSAAAGSATAATTAVPAVPAATTSVPVVPAATTSVVPATTTVTTVPEATTAVVYAPPTPGVFCYDSWYYPWPLLWPVAFGAGVGYGYYDFRDFGRWGGRPVVAHVAAVSVLGGPAVGQVGRLGRVGVHSGPRHFFGRGFFSHFGRGGGSHHR